MRTYLKKYIKQYRSATNIGKNINLQVFHNTATSIQTAIWASPVVRAIEFESY